MRRETRCTAIPSEVKDAVWARDNGRCVLCGSRNAGPWCHYIPRSRGGLGIEENIVTLCDDCHSTMDRGTGAARQHAKGSVRAYLQALYQNWTEENLIYRKGEHKC